MSRANPFEKFLGIEDRLQISCFQYAQMQFKGLLIHHSPNEGRRTPFEQYKIRQLGVKAGFPDFICFNNFQTSNHDISTAYKYKGLAIEFKAIYKNGKKNTETPEQIEWGGRLIDQGFFYTVITSFDDFKKLVDECYKHLRK